MYVTFVLEAVLTECSTHVVCGYLHDYLVLFLHCCGVYFLFEAIASLVDYVPTVSFETHVCFCMFVVVWYFFATLYTDYIV